ncbi:MAG: Lrp/AsnC family transcriptional regulator [Lachnospiraceae bacterium]|nr:Lrp/AsnC family transcriptional regulator [Lachnospiraceae bacterium]
MREAILSLLEKNSKLTFAEIAEQTGISEKEVIDTIKVLEEESVICGYNTLINWDKTDREFVTALIEVKVTPQRGNGFDKIAERIYSLEEVKAVYLMSGGFDLTVIIEAKSLKDIAFFVSDKLSPINAVTSTATHFVLKKYKDHGIILENEEEEFKRMEFPDLV